MRPTGNSLKIIAAQLCICGFLIFLYLIYNQFKLQSESLIYPACVFLLALTIWSFWSWQILTKSLFNPYNLFFLAAVIFNGGQACLEVFHLNEHGLLGNKFSSNTLLNTLYIVILSLAFLHLGGLLSAGTGKVLYAKQSHEKKADLINIQDSCRIFGWFMFSIALFPTIANIKDAMVVVLSSGYAALYQQNVATSFGAAPSILADFLIPSTLFLVAGSKEKRNTRLIAICSVIVYALSKLFLGERNQAVMPLCSLAWLWHVWIRPLPKIYLGIAALIMLIIFPFIAASRGATDEDRLSVNFVLETFSSTNNPVIASISEMGESMQTVAFTLELVPSLKDFEMGVGYLYALLTLMPNLFWSVHPTVARGIPDEWLVQEVNPGWAAHGGSIGFSFIAEAYLNFGWWGTPIVLGLIGFLYGKLTLWAARSENPARMAAVASYTSFFLLYTRGEAALVIRALVWYALIPYLCVRTISRSRLKGLPR